MTQHSPRLFLGISAIFALVIAMGFSLWRRGPPLLPQKGPAPFSSREPIPASWASYFNPILGIRLSHPREYCVVFRTRSELIDAGHSDLGKPSTPEYYLEIQDAREPATCGDLFLLGYSPIVSLQVFQIENETSLPEWSQSRRVPGITVLQLPPIIIDGIPAQRSLSGEGTPNGGAPSYHILFQRGRHIFGLFTNVPSCTARDGSCAASEDRKRIDEVEQIANTIRFVREGER